MDAGNALRGKATLDEEVSPGRQMLWPMLIWLGFVMLGLAAVIAVTVVPWDDAIVPKVSPDLTRYLLGQAAGMPWQLYGCPKKHNLKDKGCNMPDLCY